MKTGLGGPCSLGTGWSIWGEMTELELAFKYTHKAKGEKEQTSEASPDRPGSCWGLVTEKTGESYQRSNYFTRETIKNKTKLRCYTVNIHSNDSWNNNIFYQKQVTLIIKNKPAWHCSNFGRWNWQVTGNDTLLPNTKGLKTWRFSVLFSCVVHTYLQISSKFITDLCSPACGSLTRV